MTTSASIVAKLLLDATGYNKEVDKAKEKTDGLTKDGKAGIGSFGKAFESLTGISLGAAGALTVAFMAVKAGVKWLNEAEQAAVESAKADAKLEAVLISTGYAAGMTVDELKSLTQELSKSAGMDDEVITSAEAVLLTFTKLGKQVFPETMQAAIDMSAVLGQDLQSSVTMIGKAMNDFTGYTALKRAGVSFTAEQIKQIENFKDTNDLIGYQKLLLKELQTEYGGAAKKINDAGDGLENLKIAQENYNESAGKGLIPIKKAWNEFWTDFYEGATIVQDAINKQREATQRYNRIMQELGYTMGTNLQGQKAWVKDGVALTKTQSDALVVEKEAAEDAAAAVDALNEKFSKLDMSDPRTYFHWEYINGVLTAVPGKAEEAADAILDYSAAYAAASGYIEQFMNMSGKTAEQIEADTKRIILAMTEQQLAADGLSEDEMNYLLTLGVQMGVYSQQAVDAYHKAEEAARAYANMIKSMPSQKTITIVTNYVSNHPQGYVPATGSTMGKAVGGQTVANTMYPVNESGKPEVLSIGQEDYLMMGNQSGMVSQFYDTPSETKAPAYSGPTAREIGKEAGAAMANTLKQLGLV